MTRLWVASVRMMHLPDPLLVSRQVDLSTLILSNANSDRQPS